MKAVRVVFLLIILVLVAFYTKLQRLDSTSWAEPLTVSIYPINADGSPLTERYIDNLSGRDFRSIDEFFIKEWLRYSELDFKPVTLVLRHEVLDQPPEPPSNDNVLKIIFWSLRLRLWAYQHSIESDKGAVNIFVRYHQPNESRRLAHSLGLQKGLLGVVNAYATTGHQERNNIVIAHELLHTVGASDKYDLTTGQPVYPGGFAVPANQYNQSTAEIMAGKIPLNKSDSVMAKSLRQCVVGDKTAAEIRWLEADINVNQ